jgi:ethanolamine utilization protein EutA (predicted chaperonin)
LQGSGKLNRFIPLVDETTLDDPAVQDLIAQAIKKARVPLESFAAGCLVIKSISAKQRPRRPS